MLRKLKRDKKGKVIFYGSLGIVSLFILICLIIFIYQIQLASASLVKGVNSGFVTVAPTDDPTAGDTTTIDSYAIGFKDVAPAGAIKITEMGWYCSDATQAANFEIGIYSHDVVNDRPDALLEADQTNAKGTTAGWKKATGLNITVDAGTTYWLAVQLDDTATATHIDEETSGGTKWVKKGSQSTLPSSWGTSTLEYDGRLLSVYAVYEIEAADTCSCPGSGSNWEVNMSDYCIISDYCDLGTGNLTFVSTGNFTCNSQIDLNNMEYPETDQTIWINSDCVINIG